MYLRLASLCLLLLLCPMALSAQHQSQPQRVLVVQFQHHVPLGNTTLYPDYFNYDPAWADALEQVVDSLLRVRLGEVQVRFRQEEAVAFVGAMFPEVAVPLPQERSAHDLLVWINSSVRPGSQTQTGNTLKFTSRLVVQVRVEDAAGKKVWQEKVVARFGSPLRRDELRPMSQHLIGPADFQRLYGQALWAAFQPKPPKLPLAVVTPPEFDIITPEGTPVADFNAFMDQADTGRLLQKNANLLLHNASFMLSLATDSTVSALDLREEVAADRLAGAVVTGIVNDALNSTVVHKVKRFELHNHLSRQEYRLRVLSEVIGDGVNTQVEFLQDKNQAGIFRLVGYQAYEGTFENQPYYLTYNPTLDRVLIYEDDGLSLMVNQGPRDRDSKLFPYDLYFFQGLPPAKKAALLNVYLSFRLAKLLENNALNRKVEKEVDALEERP